MGGSHLRGLDVNGKVTLKLTVEKDFENVECTQLADQWRDPVDSILNPERAEFRDQRRIIKR